MTQTYLEISHGLRGTYEADGGLTRVSAALRGRAAVRALGLAFAAAAEGDAGGIGTVCTAGVGVWSRMGARAVEEDERKRGEGRWRGAAAHPGHGGVGGEARRDEVDLRTVRSMLVDARRDMTSVDKESGSELLADGAERRGRAERASEKVWLASDWLAVELDGYTTEGTFTQSMGCT